jgi:hypothetical protein
VNPPAPKPQPEPIVDPSPAPAPKPIVRPDPGPVVPPKPPTPIDPVATVTIADAAGKPLTNAVDAGHLFVVSAGDGVRLTPFPSNADDADVIELADNRLNVVLRNGCQLQVVISGAGRPTIMLITCNRGPQPPPVPDPVPDPPKPDPNPQPVVTGPLSIGIIEDAANRSVEMSALLSNHTFLEKYRAAGHKLRIWNGGDHPSTEKEAVADIQSLKAANVSLPGLVARDALGKVVLCIACPTDTASFLSVLKPFTGIAQ